MFITGTQTHIKCVCVCGGGISGGVVANINVSNKHRADRQI